MAFAACSLGARYALAAPPLHSGSRNGGVTRRAALSGARRRGGGGGVTPLLTRAAALPLNERVIDDLAPFAIPRSVAFEEGNGGMPKVVLTHKNGSRAEVYLYGACVTSWVQPSGDEVLYVRPDAVWDRSKPISGGVPICFPQFGPGPMKQHGFARELDWKVIGTSADPNPDDPEPSVMFKLRDTEYTRSMWDHKFEATFEVTLRSSKLMMELCVRNPPGAKKPKPLDFTASLHAYVEVTDASSPGVFVRGLAGKTYLDKAVDPRTPPPFTRAGDVTFGAGLVDQMYLGTEAEAMLHVGSGAAVSVENTAGWADTVVWNPGPGGLPGVAADTWKRFVCVESAVVGTPVVLQPEEVWRGETNLTVVDL